jgi:hypothetical protein
VSEPHIVERKQEDRVRPALGAGGLVVLGGDCDHLPERRLETPRGRPQDRRVPADGLDAVVVEVFVRDQQQVRFDAFDRRILELHASCRQRRDVAEGVDEDRAILSAQAKGGLAVPINARDAPLVPCPLPSGCVRDADARR